MTRNFFYFLAGMVLAILFFVFIAPAEASGYHGHKTVHKVVHKTVEKHVHKTVNHYHETGGAITNTTMSITEGVSDEDLARGIATAGAVNHQFDFSYSGMQGSVNGAFYDDESAVSFALAKRFEGMNALWHGSFTENGGLQLVTVGATFRF